MEQGATSGAAYLVQPDAGPGPGVLVLHSWWGLTRTVKDTVERLADAGFTTMAPDLCDGEVPDDPESAQRLLVESDPNLTARLVVDSILALRSRSADPTAPVAIVGYSMGASWALWAATRLPQSVRAVVAYSGAQNIDFDGLLAPVLGHFADADPLVSEDELVEMQARLLLSDKHVEVQRYPGTGHWFAEPGVVTHHDPEAAALAWQRTLDFLAEHHRST
jgi:carboxymethylenebutenolidase